MTRAEVACSDHVEIIDIGLDFTREWTQSDYLDVLVLRRAQAGDFSEASRLDARINTVLLFAPNDPEWKEWAAWNAC